MCPRVHLPNTAATGKRGNPYPVLSSSIEMTPRRRTFTVTAHTADIAVEVYGHDIRELFINAAHALNAITFDSSAFDGDTLREVRLDSVDDDTLLVDWLNELIYVIDAEQIVFGEFRALQHQSGTAEILCRGETLEPARHKQTREVKAATYYGAHIARDAQGYTARIVFDV